MENSDIVILDEYYQFVIDCTEYSGNYEREMTAYITGKYGECGVGKDISKDVESELENFIDKIDDIVMLKPDDDNGCYRPCEIVPTPGWINNGMGVHSRINPDDPPSKGYNAYNSVGIFLNKVLSDELLNLFCDRAKNYNNYLNKKKKEAEDLGKSYYGNYCGEVEGFRMLQLTLTSKTLTIW